METLHRVEIPHAQRLLYFRAMQSIRVVRNFHANCRSSGSRISPSRHSVRRRPPLPALGSGASARAGAGVVGQALAEWSGWRSGRSGGVVGVAESGVRRGFGRRSPARWRGPGGRSGVGSVAGSAQTCTRGGSDVVGVAGRVCGRRGFEKAGSGGGVIGCRRRRGAAGQVPGAGSGRRGLAVRSCWTRGRTR